MGQIWNPETGQWDPIDENHPAINAKDGNEVYDPNKDFPDDDYHRYMDYLDRTSGKDNRKVTHLTSSPRSTTGSKGGTATIHRSCRHEPTEVFKIDGVEYYGGSESKAGFFDGVTICLLGRSTEVKPCVEVAKHRKNQFNGLATQKYLARPIDLSINWRDMGAPPLIPEFWRQLHASIVKMQAETALFFCMGGHGRTGTALAAMLVCNRGYSPKQALLEVRESYCDQAVESDSQIRYLNWLWYQQPGDDSQE